VIWGFRTIKFEPVTWLGWLVFHALDVAAVLVLGGCAFFLWRRFRDREVTTGQRFGYDFLPLVALVAISVTGLLLTLSSALLEGEGYEFLAIIHMATVVLTLVFIPFGKFFHVIQRPASLGVEVYKRTSIEREGVFSCRRCGEPLEGVTYIRDLQSTMGELGLRYGEWIETCPRCKRVLRGEAYLRDVKRGFQ
jgi:nitrate reductase gamma subunit